MAGKRISDKERMAYLEERRLSDDPGMYLHGVFQSVPYRVSIDAAIRRERGAK